MIVIKNVKNILIYYSNIKYESIISIINKISKSSTKTTIETIFRYNTFILKKYKKYSNIIIIITTYNDERNIIINARIKK